MLGRLLAWVMGQVDDAELVHASTSPGRIIPPRGGSGMAKWDAYMTTAALVRACERAVAYDAAIQACANDPVRMASWPERSIAAPHCWGLRP